MSDKHEEVIGEVIDEMVSRLGAFNTGADRPMFSFDYPAISFWSGALRELIGRGYSQEQAFDFLQSKHTRWMFDGMSSEAVEFIGKLMTRAYLIANRLKPGEV